MTALEGWLGAGVAVIAGGALLAATRAFVWPRAVHDPALVGFPRATLLLAVGACCTGLVVAAWVWWRSRGSQLSAARRIDTHLGLDDVVASGLAFATEDTPGPAAALSTSRARDAVRTFDAAAAVPMPRLRPRAKRALLALGIAVLGVGLGTLDSRVVSALVAPTTPEEHRAASALEEAAAELERSAPEETEETRRQGGARTERGIRREDSTKHGRDRALAAQARQVAEATQRGDRRAALRTLRRIAATRARRARRVRRRTARLSSIASALGAPPSPQHRGSPHDRASEQARQMSRLLRRRRPNAANPEAERRAARERRRTLEQLERAASRARRRGRSELSEALREAAQALSREQDAAAAEALERAATALERLEVQVALAQMTLARQAPLARRAAATERALQLAGMGRGPSGQGATPTEAGRGGQAAAPGGGRQLSARLMNRLAALGLAQGPSTSAGGGGSRGRRGPPQASLTPSGDTHARSQVTGVGQQAVTALEGIGTDGEPTTEYRDVYPSYGVRVEEALADERIPASRRATVRRYFESIRPDESEQEEP